MIDAIPIHLPTPFYEGLLSDFGNSQIEKLIEERAILKKMRKVVEAHQEGELKQAIIRELDVRISIIKLRLNCMF